MQTMHHAFEHSRHDDALLISIFYLVVVGTPIAYQYITSNV